MAEPYDNARPTHEHGCERARQIDGRADGIGLGPTPFLSPSGVTAVHEGPHRKGREKDMDADAEYRIDERDFGLDDERPPDDTRHDADSPEPQWLRVLLWQQASPNAQVWVTVPAEGQPEGALWVGPANDPGPRSSRICVVTDPVAAAPAQSEPDSGPTRVGDAGSPPAGVVISAEGIGALAATGATLLTSSKGMETVVDRIVQAAVEGLVRSSAPTLASSGSWSPL